MFGMLIFVYENKKRTGGIIGTMMGGSPSWWNMHNNLRSSSTSDHHQHNPTSCENHLLLSSSLHINLHNNSSTSSPSSSSSSSSATTSSSSLLPFSSLASHHHPHQEFPHSWSQLLLGGLDNEQEKKFGPSLFQSTRVIGSSVDDVKQEVTSSNTNNNNNNLFGYHPEVVEQEASVSNGPSPWFLTIPNSSPKSCVTSLNSNTNINNNNNMLDFSTSKISLQPDSHQHVDQSNSESNSANGGAPNKKPKLQSSSNPPLKVRKEKLGDRITSLHQLVSPFGKTDTASVLLEAIGYIRFLQGQIEALSSPYMGNNNASNQQSVHGERNCLFPDHPGQLLNDSCLRRGAASAHKELKDATRDLKGRGLCVVPISCTQLVGSDNGAYWAPSLGGGF